MKRILTCLLIIVGSVALCGAQTKSVSILGDSYSTFEGFVTPETNEMWYYAQGERGRTDVLDVRQTWWHQLIKNKGWKLCVNNSYSGSTISYSGYSGNDYSQRSFLTRMKDLGCPDVIFIFGATNAASQSQLLDVPSGHGPYAGVDDCPLCRCRHLLPAERRIEGRNQPVGKDNL